MEQAMCEATGTCGKGAAAAPAAAPGAAFDRGAAAASLGGVNVASCKKPDGPSGSGHVTSSMAGRSPARRSAGASPASTAARTSPPSAAAR
jgi:hypothetical protein